MLYTTNHSHAYIDVFYYISPAPPPCRTQDQGEPEYQDIAQVDLVPTVSLLLGAPIPYSSLGRAIGDLFQGQLLEALRVNAAQVGHASVNTVYVGHGSVNSLGWGLVTLQ